MTTFKGFITGAATTALDTRKANAGLIANDSAGAARTGVLTDNPSIVSTDASTSPMRVKVAKAGFVTSRSTADGVAVWGNDGDIFVTVTKPASNSHIVVIYAKHNDSAAGDANNLPVVEAVAGAAAASPVKPTIPVGAEELATLVMPSTATSTQSAGVTLTNTYKLTATAGGVVKCRNATELAAWTPSDGSLALRLDVDGLFERDGGSWVELSRATGWESFTPTWTAVNSAPSVGNGSLIGRFRRSGKSIEFRIYLVFGSTSSGGTGEFAFALPAQASSAGEQIVLAKAFTAGSLNWLGFGNIGVSASNVQPYMPGGAGSEVWNGMRNANSSGTVGTGVPQIGSSYTMTTGSNLTIQGIYEAA